MAMLADHSGVILGVGAPNLCRSGDKTMCAILLTNHGLIRIYPIPGQVKFPVWSEVNVNLTQPQSDSRRESWSLRDYSITGKITDPSEKRAILDKIVLRSDLDDPIEFQNRNCRSICVIKPLSLGAAIDSRNAIQDRDWVHTQGKSWAKPYISWTSQQGNFHKSHLVSREGYETIRRNPHSPWKLFCNLNIGSPDWDFWLVMGNLKNRRNVWCCIHVHRLKKTSGLSIPLYCNLINGKPADWPYLNQGTGNVTVADEQLLMFTTNDM